MGLFDFLQKFKKQDTSGGRSPSAAINDVKQAAAQSNYNEASVKAFYALQEIGRSYAAIDRSPSTTAREYGKMLVESGRTTDEEIHPIIYNFEIAKYSPLEVTFDDYNVVEQTLESVHSNFKKGGSTTSKGSKARTAKKQRRKPKKRSTGARRRGTE
jgi:hypothetical protein